MQALVLVRMCMVFVLIGDDMLGLSQEVCDAARCNGMCNGVAGALVECEDMEASMCAAQPQWMSCASGGFGYESMHQRRHVRVVILCWCGQAVTALPCT